MKIFIGTFLLCLTVNSFAGIGGSVGGSSGNRSIKLGKRLITIQDFDESLSYIVNWPEVKFQEQSVPVKNTCLDGNTIRTITPVKICASYRVDQICSRNNKNQNEVCRKRMPGENPVDSYYVKLVYSCEKTIETSLETSKFYEIDVCDEWTQDDAHTRFNTCSHTKKETRELPSEFNIPVTKRSSNGGGNIIEVKSFVYGVPTCTGK